MPFINRQQYQRLTAVKEETAKERRLKNLAAARKAKELRDKHDKQVKGLKEVLENEQKQHDKEIADLKDTHEAEIKSWIKERDDLKAKHEALMLYLGTGMIGFLAFLLRFRSLVAAIIVGIIPLLFWVGSEIYLEIKYK